MSFGYMLLDLVIDVRSDSCWEIPDSAKHRHVISKSKCFISSNLASLSSSRQLAKRKVLCNSFINPRMRARLSPTQYQVLGAAAYMGIVLDSGLGTVLGPFCLFSLYPPFPTPASHIHSHCYKYRNESTLRVHRAAVREPGRWATDGGGE